MFDPEEEFTPEKPEQNDRVNGEYHYKNGYSQRIYSDAHYVRADESTTPPRYYIPPQKPEREEKPRSSRKGVGLGAVIASCLVCAMLGGIGGSALVASVLNRRIDDVSQSVTELSERQPILQQTTVAAPAAAASTVYTGEMSAGDLYDMACQQVVGVSTAVTYTNFFGMPVSAAVSGSGFIITADGYIMTNCHVVEDAYKRGLEVSVILHDGTRYSAQVVGIEPDNDIAILKIDATGLNAATLGNSDTMRVGDSVYAVGNPLGELDFSMTSGHVSAKDRRIVTDSHNEAIPMFQFDAAINSGNSGGPVYNARGEVVGVATAKPASSGVEGISFAIPINDAAIIAKDILTTGYVTGKAWLGVTVNSKYNQMYAQYYGWPLGAYIDSVTSGSCAETAGIQAGDIITAIDGEEITGYDGLRAAIKRHSAGETVEVELYRADESRTVTVTFDEERPEPN